MNFENPRALGALLLLLPLALAMIAHYLRRRRALLFFEKDASVGPAVGLAGSLAGGRARAGKIRFRYWVSSLAFLAFFFFTALALAGPRWGIRLVPEFRRGIDAVLAFDLSRSMDARDSAAGISRLERAAAIARDTVAGDPVSAPETAGIRFAAAVSKGQGILAIPLTHDAEALSGFLAGLSTSQLTGRGTNLEKLVDAAALAFKDDFPGKRRIILFSDGEALSGSLAAASDRCLARDISIIAVGLGTEEGALVPPARAFPGLGPAAGEGPGQEAAISRADREALRRAAIRTGGLYIDGDDSAASSLLAESLAQDGESGPRKAGAPDSEETGFRREPKSQRHLFILAALAFFGLSKLLACEFRRRPSPTPLPEKQRALHV